MRKLIFIALFFFSITIKVSAQSGYKYLNLDYGYLVKPLKAQTLTIALDFAGRYHDSWELYLKAYKSDYTEHLSFILDTNTKAVIHQTNYLVRHNYTGGLIYKPLILRSTNTSLRLKAGLGLGSETNIFIMELQGGFELSHAIGGGFELMIQQNNGFVFYDAQHWRSGISLGVKIPIF